MSKRISWEGVARMDCSSLRELTLYDDEPMPTVLFCYGCRTRNEPIARLAEYAPLAACVPS